MGNFNIQSETKKRALEKKGFASAVHGTHRILDSFPFLWSWSYHLNQHFHIKMMNIVIFFFFNLCTVRKIKSNLKK